MHIHFRSPPKGMYINPGVVVSDGMLTTGEKCILAMAQANGSRISKLRLTKLLFLVSQEQRIYDFVPYLYGPFSFQMYHDLADLARTGLIAEEGNMVETLGAHFPAPPAPLHSLIDRFITSYQGFTDEELLERIYSDNPWYTILSMNNRRMDYRRDLSGIATIGYEGKTIDGFLNELLMQRIGSVIDVRSNPFSYKFGFCGSVLQEYLSKLDIEYLHLPEMGIPSRERKHLKTEADLKSLFKAYDVSLNDMRPALTSLIRKGAEKRIALMCMEKDVNRCHRGVIGNRLRRMGQEVMDL